MYLDMYEYMYLYVYEFNLDAEEICILYDGLVVNQMFVL